MPIKDDLAADDLAPDDPLPLFFTSDADKTEQRGSSRAISIRVIAATLSAMVIALWQGNPVRVLADATASRTEIPTAPTATDLEPTIESPIRAEKRPTTANVQVSASTANQSQALLRDVVASETAPQTNTENTTTQTQPENNNSGPSSEALFREYQSWSATQTRQARKSGPAVQHAPAHVVDNPRAHSEPQHHDVPSAESAQRKAKHVQNLRAKGRPDQKPQLEARPVQDAPSPQNQPVNGQAPSFLQILGLHQ